jgi:hypothetical protein
MMVVMTVGDKEDVIVPAKPVWTATDAFGNKVPDGPVKTGVCLTTGSSVGTPMSPRFDFYMTVTDLEMLSALLDSIPSRRRGNKIIDPYTGIPVTDTKKEPPG